MLYTPRHVSSQKKEGLNPLFRGKVTQRYFNSEEIMLLEKKKTCPSCLGKVSVCTLGLILRGRMCMGFPKWVTH